MHIYNHGCNKLLLTNQLTDSKYIQEPDHISAIYQCDHYHCDITYIYSDKITDSYIYRYDFVTKADT